MFERVEPLRRRWQAPTPQAEPPAEERWENEGGPAQARATWGPPAPAIRVREPDSTETSLGDLDSREVELMATTSSDGRPPTPHRRQIEWRWVFVAWALIIAAIGGWFIIDGAGPRPLGFGLAFAVVMLLGACPVLGAGLLRAREERAARDRARHELAHDNAQTP